MLIESVEQFKEWLTSSLSPICEADPGALAKYVVALVKKDKPIQDLKNSCVDQLEVFLQTKTKEFVETLFEVLENKSYIVKTEEPAPAPLPDSAPSVTPVENDATPTSSDQQLVTSTSKIDIKKEEELQKAFPIIDKRPKSRSRSLSPRTRIREDDRRRRPDDRRNYDRGYPHRRSTSPRLRRYRSRSPYRRRSPFRPVRRSPGPRGVGRGRSRSRSWTRSRSRSPRRWSRSRSRDRIRSPGGRLRSRSPGGRIRSRSPGGRIRSRSPGGRIRSRSPGGRIRSRSPGGRIRSRSPGGRIRSRSPSGRIRSRSPGGRSPRREVRARSPRGRSPYRRSVSPRFRSRSPRKRSRSPGFGGSRSPRSRSSISPNRSRSRSPVRKVRRNSDDSRGPTPTQENGLADSTNPTPTDSHSSISVVTHSRYGEGQSASRMRCRDYDEKGFCVRGDLCVYDHGNDPVVVENVAQYPPGPPPGMSGPPPPPGHPMHMAIPPPGFFSNRMPAPPIHVRPDFPQEPYNPEAPGLTRPGPPPYWPRGPDNMPPFMKGPPPSVSTAGHVPVKSRLGNRDLVNLTVKREVKDEPEDEDAPSSSTRTVIAPKDEPPLTVTVTQPPPPGVPTSEPPQSSAPGPQQGFYSHQQRFHPYQRFPGPRKPFDYNRIGGYRRPDQTNCTLEVRKIPKEFNNIAKLNEHFGKFGTLTNIQVSFEGDPEGALVTFSSNQEALSCYKCSEPVFNNRFIKVFWHQKNKENNNQDASSVSTTTQGVPQEESSLSVKSRLGPIPPASKMQLNNLIKKSTEVAGTTDTSPTNTQPDQSVTYTSSVGNISKTVYNPAVAAAMAKAKAQAAQTSLSSPTAVKAADFVSKMEKVKQMEAMKKEAAAKKLEIQKHKQELLEKQIEQQKKLIATLEKNKDMKEANKKTVMETLKTLSNSIDKLKTELSGQNIIKSDAAAALGVKSPEQAKKEILDVELELMTKTNAEETLELKKKLNELTKVANSMGLLGRGRGRGSVARGRAATTWVASGITPPAGPPVFGRGRGRGALLGKAAVATRTLDRRPKVVEVTGFDAEEKEEITSHLNGLKEVEKLEFNMDIPSAIVAFKTRRDAEMGILHGSKFKTKTLKMNWHIPKPDFSRSLSHNSASTEDHEEIDEEALLAGVEDEEEETEEERSWRP